MASPTGSTVSGSSIDEDLLNFDLREAEGSSEGQCIEYPGLKKAYNEAPLDMAMPDGDDSFKTPPQSPSEIHRSRRLSTDKARSTVTGKRESPDANYFGGSRKRSMHQADVSSPPPSFRRGVIPTSSDSVTAFADMGISSSKTNTNHSFTTNATSLSFGEWKSSDNTREDSSQKVKVRGIVRSDSDPSKPISTKAEQSTFPCRLPEVSGYLDVRQQSNRDPGKSSLEMRLHDYSPLCSYVSLMKSLAYSIQPLILTEAHPVFPYALSTKSLGLRCITRSRLKISTNIYIPQIKANSMTMNRFGECQESTV